MDISENEKLKMNNFYNSEASMFFLENVLD